MYKKKLFCLYDNFNSVCISCTIALNEKKQIHQIIIFMRFLDEKFTLLRFHSMYRCTSDIIRINRIGFFFRIRYAQKNNSDR